MAARGVVLLLIRPGKYQPLPESRAQLTQVVNHQGGKVSLGKDVSILNRTRINMERTAHLLCSVLAATPAISRALEKSISSSFI